MPVDGQGRRYRLWMPERLAQPDPLGEAHRRRVTGQERFGARLGVPTVERPGVQLAAEPVGLVHDRDPGLRAQLTPDYRIGCKRILISNDYLPSLSRPNVELVASGLAEVRPRSAVAADGTEHDIDTIIFGTGFHVTDIPVADRISGRDGLSLKGRWAGGMTAYKGTTVAGFPNLFLLVGPNTGLGHSSQVFMIESQIAYVLDAVRHLERTGGVVEVRADTEAAWDAGVQRAMGRTVWTTGGCASWYLDSQGRNTTLWPGSTGRFRRRTARFDPGAYRVVEPPAEVGANRRSISAVSR